MAMLYDAHCVNQLRDSGATIKLSREQFIDCATPRPPKSVVTPLPGVDMDPTSIPCITETICAVERYLRAVKQPHAVLTVDGGAFPKFYKILYGGKDPPKILLNLDHILGLHVVISMAALELISPKGE